MLVAVAHCWYRTFCVVWEWLRWRQGRWQLSCTSPRRSSSSCGDEICERHGSIRVRWRSTTWTNGRVDADRRRVEWMQYSRAGSGQQDSRRGQDGSRAFRLLPAASLPPFTRSHSHTPFLPLPTPHLAVLSVSRLTAPHSAATDLLTPTPHCASPSLSLASTLPLVSACTSAVSARTAASESAERARLSRLSRLVSGHCSIRIRYDSVLALLLTLSLPLVHWRPLLCHPPLRCWQAATRCQTLTHHRRRTSASLHSLCQLSSRSLSPALPSSSDRLATRPCHSLYQQLRGASRT